MSGKAPVSPRHPSSRHPRPSDPTRERFQNALRHSSSSRVSLYILRMFKDIVFDTRILETHRHPVYLCGQEVQKLIRHASVLKCSSRHPRVRFYNARFRPSKVAIPGSPYRGQNWKIIKWLQEETPQKAFFWPQKCHFPDFPILTSAGGPWDRKSKSRRRKRWKTNGEKMVDFWCRFFSRFGADFSRFTPIFHGL